MNTKLQEIMKKGRETRVRHSKLSCKVFTIKVDKSKLNKLQLKHIKSLFYEAKWVYNDIISFISNDNDLNHYDTKLKEVKVKTPETFEMRKLQHISSQMKQ